MQGDGDLKFHIVLTRMKATVSVVNILLTVSVSSCRSFSALSIGQSVVMSEFPKICKYSSTQAISPQCLNVFISNLIWRFLRGLGIFPCAHC